MTKNEIIIELVKAGFNYTFDYVLSDRYLLNEPTRSIIFFNEGYRSVPILMSSLDESIIERVKNFNI
jgi:hypothetical protein